MDALSSLTRQTSCCRGATKARDQQKCHVVVVLPSTKVLAIVVRRGGDDVLVMGAVTTISRNIADMQCDIGDITRYHIILRNIADITRDINLLQSRLKRLSNLDGFGLSG